MVDRLTTAQAHARISGFFEGDTQAQIITLNPEMCVAARSDEAFAETIRNAAIRVCDGFGIRLLSGFKIPACITGTQVLHWLAQACRKRGSRLLLLGGSGDQAMRAQQQLEQLYPGLKTVAINPGGIEKTGETWTSSDDLIQHIQKTEPEAIAVALGHKKQEQWIADHLDQLPSVRVAVGVGGVFAFLSGDIKRAPRWMQRCGMEWLWRLIQEPTRLKRIFMAVVVFPILTIFDRIRGV